MTITATARAAGHRYTMGHVNAYCPACSDEHSDRLGRFVTVLTCDFDDEG